MASGRRDEGGQASHELERREAQMGGAVAPAGLELIEQLAIGTLVQSLAGDRRPRDIAAEALEALAIARRNRNACMEVDSAQGDAELPRCALEVFDVDAISEACQWASRSRSEHGTAPDGS